MVTYKRNQKLHYKGPFFGAFTPVIYVKKFGRERPNYVVVKFPDGENHTVWTFDLTPVE